MTAPPPSDTPTPRVSAAIESALDYQNGTGDEQFLRDIVQLARTLERDLAAATAQLQAVQADRESWEKVAAQFHRNQLYYAGLLDQIGEALGPPAYTQDDGGKVTEPLRAKVPELAIAAITALQAAQRDAERYRWLKLKRPAEFTDDGIDAAIAAGKEKGNG